MANALRTPPLNEAFFRAYRTVGLLLGFLLLVTVPLATLAVAGVLPWLSPVAGLFIWLADACLVVVLFVAGAPTGLSERTPTEK